MNKSILGASIRDAIISADLAPGKMYQFWGNSGFGGTTLCQQVARHFLVKELDVLLICGEGHPSLWDEYYKDVATSKHICLASEKRLPNLMHPLTEWAPPSPGLIIIDAIDLFSIDSHGFDIETDADSIELLETKALGDVIETAKHVAKCLSVPLLVTSHIQDRCAYGTYLLGLSPDKSPVLFYASDYSIKVVPTSSDSSIRHGFFEVYRPSTDKGLRMPFEFGFKPPAFAFRACPYGKLPPVQLSCRPTSYTPKA